MRLSLEVSKVYFSILRDNLSCSMQGVQAHGKIKIFFCVFGNSRIIKPKMRKKTFITVSENKINMTLEKNTHLNLKQGDES